MDWCSHNGKLCSLVMNFPSVYVLAGYSTVKRISLVWATKPAVVILFVWNFFKVCLNALIWNSCLFHLSYGSYPHSISAGILLLLEKSQYLFSGTRTFVLWAWYPLQKHNQGIADYHCHLLYLLLTAMKPLYESTEKYQRDSVLKHRQKAFFGQL